MEIKQWLTSYFGHLPQERTLVPIEQGTGKTPGASLDVLEKRKISGSL